MSASLSLPEHHNIIWSVKDMVMVWCNDCMWFRDSSRVRAPSHPSHAHNRWSTVLEPAQVPAPEQPSASTSSAR